LNEGLSHFAEELGGRGVPNTFCAQGPPNPCLSQFAGGDINDAFRYLNKDTLENTFLIEPDNSSGTLSERGANWLFVRWLADRSPTDTIHGTDITRALDGADSPTGTTLLSDANIQAVARAKFDPGATFSSLVAYWQMANYLEGVPTFTEPTGLLRYKAWDLPGIVALNPGLQLLSPDSTTNGSYNRSGILRAGSGRHLRVIQGASASSVVLQLSTGNTASIVPRIGVVRVR
jgi:hypothetical protein